MEVWISNLASMDWESLARVIVIGMVASWIALLAHEAGHALAAWSLGVRIWGIRLGVGPALWTRTVRGCCVHLALLPFLGSVQLLDADAHAIGYRDVRAGAWRFEWGPEAWRAPIISAAGGLGNLICLLLLLGGWAVLGRPAPGTLGGDLLLFGMVANFAGYLNLIPCFHSDGTHLLAHMRAARSRLAAVRLA